MEKKNIIKYIYNQSAYDCEIISTTQKQRRLDDNMI